MWEREQSSNGIFKELLKHCIMKHTIMSVVFKIRRDSLSVVAIMP